VQAAEPFVQEEVLAEVRDRAVARCALGCTLYLHDSLTWAKGGIARALDSFLRRAPTERLEWYTTSMIDRWIRTSPATVSALLESVPLGWSAGRSRHLFGFRLVDDTEAPECWFAYREIDDTIADCAGYLSIGFPQSFSPRALSDFVVEIAQSESYYCGTAGYLGSFNEWEKPTSFSVFHRWGKRYLGLDLEDPDRFGWAAKRGLVTTSWLTLIGRPLMESVAVHAQPLLRKRFRHNVEAIDGPAGIIVRAGASPTLGDVNSLKFPHAYAEAARALEPFMTPSLPSFYGPFYGTDDTVKWQRRLVAPEDW
jgi:hypothetical protein